MMWLFEASKNPTITPLVSGVQDGSDPSHPTEVYYGEAIFNDLDSMLQKLGVTIYPEDKFTAFPGPSLNMGSKVTINRATSVTVNDAGHMTTYRTWTNNVADLLQEKNIELLGQDTAEPAPSTPLSTDMTIKITRVAEVDVTETVLIDFKKAQRQSADLEKGQTKIETKGVPGQKEVVYTIKRVDGVEVSKTLKSSKIIKEPVTQVTIVGIGPKLAKSGPYVDIINAAAKKYLINGTALMCLMMAESNGHADSIGYVKGVATYFGLFQYTSGLWESSSAKAGYAGAAWSNPTAQIYTTAYMLTHGQSSRWPPWTNQGCYKL